MPPGPIRRGRGRPRKTPAAKTPYACPSQDQIKADQIKAEPTTTIVIDPPVSAGIEADRKEPITSAPVTAAPVTRRRKGPFVKKGSWAVRFIGHADWERDANDVVGSSTRILSFGSGFVLTDPYIEDLIEGGSKVLERLTHFTIEFSDVSYTAHNSAKDLTDTVMIRLAKHCPKLQKCQLQGTKNLTDATLMAFFNYCPALIHLEITPFLNCSHNFDGSALEMLERDPDLVPQLKMLRLGHGRKKTIFMRRMKAMSKARGKLMIQLVEVGQIKQWGDWELDLTEEAYRKGRKYEPKITFDIDSFY